MWSPAAPPGASTIAVYFEARARAADALIGVSTPLADQADVHATTEVDGMMQMRPVARVDLPARKTIKLAPGGMHVMLTGVHQPLAAGAQFPLHLKFANAGEVDVTVIVKAPG